jgi:hypothetical protein
MGAVERASKNIIVGHVEQLGETFGVEGWVFDESDPTSILTLELRVGDITIATTNTGIDRADVANDLDIDARPGFCFDPAVTALLSSTAASGIEGDLSVRVLGADQPLRSLAPPRSMAAIRRNASTRDVATVDMLFERLSHHVEEAKHALALAEQWASKTATGFIESIAVDESGLVWVSGWMADDGLLDRPVVILDNGTFAGAFSCALAPRDDLPAGCMAFAGIIHTDWRPRAGRAIRIFMADGTARILASLDPLPLGTRASIMPMLYHTLDRAVGPIRDRLYDLSHYDGGWFIDHERAHPERVQIDEAAVLPGFGVFINGWALSPTKVATTFSLKAGTQIVAADADSVIRYPRPDLATLYRDIDQSLVASGVVALFRGSFEGLSLGEMVVKAGWDDGKSTAASIVPATVRVIGRTASIEIVERYYPAIEAESFFPSFAMQAASVYRERAKALRAYVAVPIARAVIFAAPTSSSDLTLLIDSIVRNVATLPEATGIVLVAGQALSRSLLMALFSDLRRHTGRQCSLFFTPASEPTADVIDSVIAALQIDHFAFLSGDVQLTSTGWAALGAEGQNITFLAVKDLVAPSLSVTASTRAFIATSATWRELSRQITPTFGGNPNEALYHSQGGAHAVVPDGAVSLGRPSYPPLLAKIDSTLRNKYA